MDFPNKVYLYTANYKGFIGHIIFEDNPFPKKNVCILWGDKICTTGYKKKIDDQYNLLGEIDFYHKVNRIDDTLESLYQLLEDIYYNSYDLHDINTNIVTYKGLYGLFNESGLLLHIVSVKN